MASRWQTHEVPLSMGMNTKTDPRVLPEGKLAVCDNARFDEVGGIQPRRPSAEILDNVSNTIADFRRIAVYDDELIAFTKDGLWSYAKNDGTWIRRGTHLATKVAEKSVFVNPREQTNCDRAELNGVVMFSWAENAAIASSVYVAALDEETGTVIMSPTLVADASVPHLIALNTVIHLYYYDTNATEWVVAEYDPTDLATAATTAVLSTNTTNTAYQDVCLNAAGDGTVWVHPVGTTSYDIRRVDEGPSLGTLTTKVRRADAPIAVAESADGDVVVARFDFGNTDVRADLLTSTLVDGTVNQVLSGARAVLDQENITARFRDTQDGGEYRCYVFYTENEATSQALTRIYYNYIDSAATLGTEAELVRRAGISSKAFAHDGHVYLWVGFGGVTYSQSLIGLRAQLQNSYFLYRDDVEICGKAVHNTAEGHVSDKGRLAAVQDLGSNKFAWCGSERRTINIGGNLHGYSEKSPKEVILEFDSDEARRTVQLGRTLYISGSELLQYDGERLTEVGFHQSPWGFQLVDDGAGNIGAGTYTYKITNEDENSKGEIDRSSTSAYAQITSAAGRQHQLEQISPLHITRRTAFPHSVVVWRTLADPSFNAPFYRVSAIDPADNTNPNRYLVNDIATNSFVTDFEDDFDDADAAVRELDSDDGSVLPNVPPPGSNILAVSQDRLFLAGISGEPHRVNYSKLRGRGEVASFHDSLYVDLPPVGGEITALAFLNETLVVFKKNAVYVLPGDGFDNLGTGQNYGPGRLISSDVGSRNAESVALTPNGILFHSEKGWYLLTQGWGVQYVGQGAAAYDDYDFSAVHVLESRHEVRCFSSSGSIVWDYLVDEWGTRSTSGSNAVIWDDRYTYLTLDTVLQEQDDWTGNIELYYFDVETAWINFSRLQGYNRVRHFMIMGEYVSASRMRIRVAYDHEETAAGVTWTDDTVWTPTPATAEGPMVVRQGPSRQRCRAIKIRITSQHETFATPPTGEAFRLTGLAFKVGVEQGLYPRLPAAQKQ